MCTNVIIELMLAAVNTQQGLVCPKESIKMVSLVLLFPEYLLHVTTGIQS